jgi:hypothetical protein
MMPIGGINAMQSYFTSYDGPEGACQICDGCFWTWPGRPLSTQSFRQEKKVRWTSQNRYNTFLVACIVPVTPLLLRIYFVGEMRADPATSV